MKLVTRIFASSFCVLCRPNFSLQYSIYISFIVFFLYKTVRKIGVVNISVFLFVNVKRRTEDSELVLNIYT